MFLNVGDICEYSFDNRNRSRSIVQIVAIRSDPRGVAEIKFLKVFVDDSGNGLFQYLKDTGKTMCASFKYLKKISLNVNAAITGGGFLQYI